MAELILLNAKIDLNATNEQLTAFCTELNLQILGTDLETASWIVQSIDGLGDAEWEAMTVELKEWSNHIQNEKTRIIEEDKKAATVEKSQATKAANAEVSGVPTTPAAIKKAINDCKNKADVATTNTAIAKALGMEAAPKITKSWTVAKQKEAAIAGLKKPKATKTPKADAPAAGAPGTKTPKTDTVKTPKASGPSRAGATAPSTANVNAAKADAKTTAAAATGPKNVIKDGEPYRTGTTSHMIFDIFKKSKAQVGLDIPAVKGKFQAILDADKSIKCANPDSRVTATIADMKNKKAVLTRLESGSYILTENIK